MSWDSRFHRLKTEAGPLMSWRKGLPPIEYTRHTRIDQNDLDYLDSLERDQWQKPLMFVIPASLFAWFVVRKAKLPSIWQNPLIESNKEMLQRREVQRVGMLGSLGKSCVLFVSFVTFTGQLMKHEYSKHQMYHKYKIMVDDYIKKGDQKFMKEFIDEKNSKSE